MRHLITLLSAVAAVTILVVGCSSSSDNSSTSSGGAGGSAGGGAGTSAGGSTSDAKCVGTYAGLTQTTFNAQVTSAGKCADASDESSICTNDVTTIAEQCGASCYATAGTASSAQDTCNTTCLSTMITPALSSDCQTCYLSDITCARTNCLVTCGIAPTSQGCMACRQMNGCVDAFYGCAGVPMPSGSPATGSAGAGDEPTAGASTAG